jgi:UMF1 family MFS transporter
VPLALVVGVPLPLLLGGVYQQLPASVAPWCGEPYTAVALVAALLAAAFVLRSVPDAPPAAMASTTEVAGRHAHAPLPPLSTVWWIYATSFLMPLGVFPLIVSADAWTESAYGFDRAGRAMLLLLLGAASVAGGLGSSLVADRLGRRRTLLASLGAFAALAAMLPFSGATAYALLAALLGMVSTVRQGPFQALASFVADQRGRGRFSARVLVASQLGIGGGQFLGDLLLRRAAVAGAKPSLLPIAAVTVGCTLAALLLAWRLREPASVVAAPKRGGATS